ncbi:Type 1 glutamine amidotransferase-like domain-containing protein [Bacillus sp. SD088]|nr:Type 1 glutamine amidotransferase-like domain-containing protein [Bacillus sp. SD088]
MLVGAEQGACAFLTGLSAGSICWFEEGVTDSYGAELGPLTCLGFLKGSHCPHYDGEAERRPTFHKLIKERRIKPGIAADDGVALHYVDQTLKKIVSSRRDAKAYEVSLTEENELKAEFLGARNS